MEILFEALNLTLFGMGFVFVFLIVLVFATSFMSKIINKSSKNKSSSITHDIAEEEIDEETKFVIEQAIKMHRGA
jgi:oxaloacetate decarboxylase gamma subunit